MIILMEKYSPYDEEQLASHRPQKEFYIVPPNQTFRAILSGVNLLECVFLPFYT